VDDRLNSVAERFDTFTSIIFNCNNQNTARCKANNSLMILFIVSFTASSILIIAVENDASKCVETFCCSAAKCPVFQNR